MKITEYPSAKSLLDDNIFIVDGTTSGTKKIPVADAILSAMHLISPENHRRIFRGKCLGNTITPEQLAAIRSGTFEDLWLGDYWVNSASPTVYRIVDFDYYYGKGDQKLAKHHLVVMPDSNIKVGKMNETATTAGGYAGSGMVTGNFYGGDAYIDRVFSEESFITYREYFTNGVSDTGYPNSGDWYTSGKFNIPNEIMIFGCHIFAAGSDGSIDVNRYTVSNSQLALFNVCPKYIAPPGDTGAGYWLRDIANKSRFAFVSQQGEASYGNANSSKGIRPYFLIG